MEGVTAASAPCSGASGSPHPSTMSPVESAQARVDPVRARDLVAQARRLQVFAGEPINTRAEGKSGGGGIRTSTGASPPPGGPPPATETGSPSRSERKTGFEPMTLTLEG
jgi:hypothetical protein